MDAIRTYRLERAQRRAWEAAEALAKQLSKAAPAEREALLAGVAFEWWLAESCRRCRL